jgi:hypothetical protein
MMTAEEVGQDIANKKKANPITTFFAGAFLSPFVASAVLLGTAAEATWDVVKAAVGAIGDIIALSIVAPLAVLGYGAFKGWELGKSFPLNILTAAAGFCMAAIPAALVFVCAPTISTIVGLFDLVKGVCNAGWTLLKGAAGSVASLFALPIVCAHEASQDAKADANLGTILEEQLTHVGSKYKTVIREDDSLLSDKPLVLGFAYNYCKSYCKKNEVSISINSGPAVLPREDSVVAGPKAIATTASKV